MIESPNQPDRTADFGRIPHLSRGGSTRANPFMIFLLAPVGLLLAAALAYLGLQSLNQYALFPAAVNLTIVTLAGLAAAWWFTRHARRAYHRGQNIDNMPAEPDNRYRVRVACWPDQAGPFHQIEDEPFEPETFRVWVPAQPLFQSLPRQLRTGRPGISGACAFMALGAITPVLLYAGIGMAVIEAILLIRDHRRPTYLRIVPGRVDLLRYPLVGNGPPGRTPLDLRTSRVYIDGIDRKLTIENGGRDTVIDYKLSRETEQITRQLLRAAVSTAEPAPLPEKDLTG